MTVVEALRARAVSLSPVTTLVSTRVYALKLPQSPTLPAVKMQQIGNVEFMHLRGSSRVCRARVQVDAYVSETQSNPYATAHAVMDAVHGDGQYTSATGLNGWRGGIGSPAFEVTGILPDQAGARDGYEVEGALRMVTVSRDYFVWFVDA